ncbi:hypothetical protein V8D89_000583 [Ganoderma adspersum]
MSGPRSGTGTRWTTYLMRGVRGGERTNGSRGRGRERGRGLNMAERGPCRSRSSLSDPLYPLSLPDRRRTSAVAPTAHGPRIAASTQASVTDGRCAGEARYRLWAWIGPGVLVLGPPTKRQARRTPGRSHGFPPSPRASSGMLLLLLLLVVSGGGGRGDNDDDGCSVAPGRDTTSSVPRPSPGPWRTALAWIRATCECDAPPTTSSLRGGQSDPGEATTAEGASRERAPLQPVATPSLGAGRGVAEQNPRMRRHADFGRGRGRASGDEGQDKTPRPRGMGAIRGLGPGAARASVWTKEQRHGTSTADR